MPIHWQQVWYLNTAYEPRPVILGLHIASQAPGRSGANTTSWWLTFRHQRFPRQISLNGSGDIAVYFTVLVIEACPKKCCRRRVSMPRLASE